MSGDNEVDRAGLPEGVPRPSAAPAAGRSRPVVAIASAWLLAGTLDIFVASVYYPLAFGVSLPRIYQGIASGVLGAQAFTGGAGTAALGLLLHYLIALIWTVLFFLVYPRLATLAKHRVATAVGYGVFVSAAMRFVVLPLSNVGARRFNLGHFAVDTLILVLTIGTPLTAVLGSYFARRAHRA